MATTAAALTSTTATPTTMWLRKKHILFSKFGDPLFCSCCCPAAGSQAGGRRADGQTGR